MYCKNVGTNEVNKLRYRLFCMKKGDIDVDSNQLPLCDDSLRRHARRTNYQAAIWKRSLQRCLEIPSPLGCGWCTEDGRLGIDWMCGLPAPKAVLELLPGQCSSPVSFLHVPVWQMAWDALTSVAFRIVTTGAMMIMSSLTMKMTMTMTMRTAMAGKGLVMKYRVVSKEAELITGKHISLVLLIESAVAPVGAVVIVLLGKFTSRLVLF